MSRNGSLDTNSSRRRRKTRFIVVFVGVCAVLGCLVVRHYWPAESASADSPAARSSAPQTSGKEQPTAAGDSSGTAELNVVAVVNNQQITRQILGQECLRHYGEAVLESLCNKRLILQECQRRGIAITREDVDAEIKRMAQRFGLARDQWLKMLQKERGVNPAQYAGDIIWPTLALRRLAGERLTVTQEELIKAFETKYGAKIDARLIACKDLAKAREAHAKAVANPDDFPKLAQAYSEDGPSASLGGRIRPICRHGTYPAIEQAAFNMEDGQISQVIPAGGQYVVVQRVREIAQVQTADFKMVAPQLEEMIRDGKLRTAAREVFQRLQDSSNITNVLNDPQKQRQMPGAAAVINGHQITLGQLAEQCIDRHGIEVLEGTINRTLIQQACRKRSITVTEADLQEEIARAALIYVDPRPDGSADVESWLKRVVEEKGISVDVYRHDEVWPSVALKKLVGSTVRVTEEDLRRGYEANYGPRVRCRAIVLGDLRRAQRVWQMAQGRPTVEYFGQLAEEYSVEPGSSALSGVVPPIKKHGGQPKLEEAAFSLKPGQLSGVIQVGQRYVILFCESYTEPTKVDFASVRKHIYDDVHEKKLRVAMAKYFQQLQDMATIDNYLAGTTRRPQQSAPARSAGLKPVVPTSHRAPPRR